MRAITSGAPPAPVVTISLTGAVGKFCAVAGVPVTAARPVRTKPAMMNLLILRSAAKPRVSKDGHSAGAPAG